jgi:ribosomal protein S18 acetylase RimI-like enzyme
MLQCSITADGPQAIRVQSFRVNTQDIVMGHPGDPSPEIPQEGHGADSAGPDTVPLPPPARPRAFGWVPIRSLSARHRPRILAHLLALDMNDRYLRFGYAAADDQIRRYVERIAFERDEIFGVFNRRLELIALAHLAYEPSVDSEPERPSAAEFGVSVAVRGRGRGYGARLFDHAVLRARNRGVDTIVIHALSENVAMLKIVRNAGATIERTGVDSEAHLRLPPENFASHLAGRVEEQLGEMDYQFKQGARQMDTLLDIGSRDEGTTRR